MNRLRRYDKVAYVRFASVYLDFKDVKEFMEELKDLVKSKEAAEIRKVVAKSSCSRLAESSLSYKNVMLSDPERAQRVPVEPKHPYHNLTHGVRDFWLRSE